MTEGRTVRTRPGIREVAAKAGVAISSVSRVLAEHADTSPHMREKVMAAVRDLGYQPDLLARGLRSRKTLSIGWLVSDISNPVMAEIVTGAESTLRAAGYSLILTNSDGEADLDAPNIRLLVNRRIDGIFLSTSREDDPRTIEAIRDIDIPYVLVDRDPPEGVTAPVAAFDHWGGMAAAAQHLVDLGHRHVAVIVGGPRRPDRQRRGAVEAVLATVEGSRCDVYEGAFNVNYGIAATRRIIGSRRRPTAIIAGGNLLMQGALRVLHDEGIRVGSDISFVGCDAVPIAELHDPQIAVVRRDNRALGVVAADLMLSALRGEGGGEVRSLPTQFVERPSCAVPAKASVKSERPAGATADDRRQTPVAQAR